MINMVDNKNKSIDDKIIECPVLKCSGHLTDKNDNNVYTCSLCDRYFKEQIKYVEVYNKGK